MLVKAHNKGLALLVRILVMQNHTESSTEISGTNVVSNAIIRTCTRRHEFTVSFYRSVCLVKWEVLVTAQYIF